MILTKTLLEVKNPQTIMESCKDTMTAQPFIKEPRINMMAFKFLDQQIWWLAGIELMLNS